MRLTTPLQLALLPGKNGACDEDGGAVCVVAAAAVGDVGDAVVGEGTAVVGGTAADVASGALVTAPPSNACCRPENFEVRLEYLDKYRF